MEPERHSKGAIEEAAYRWLAKRDRGFTADERGEFERWLDSDRRHAEAVGEITGLLAGVPKLSGLAAATGGAPDPDLLAPRASPGRWRLPAALAAAAAAVIILALAEWRPAGRRPSPLAPQKLSLNDGSVIELDPASRIEPHYTEAERDVTLVSGRANFIVAKNPARPFFVRAQGIRVRAVGTAFVVAIEEHAIAVSVSEGKVRVSHDGGGAVGRYAGEPLLVAAGHRALLPLAGGADTLDGNAVPDEAEAWLSFAGQPLARVVDEFNRHNDRKMAVADSATGSIRIGGRFQAGQIDVFLRLLDSNFNVRSRVRSDGTIVLRRKNQD